MLLGRSNDGLIYLFEQPVRLLVVDDDPIMREFAVAQLAHPGGVIMTAADGEAAWKVLQSEEDFDLVISDLEMPVMNGFALLDLIRASPRHARMPVVVITSRDDMFAIDRAYEVGATSFATKPVNWRLLGYQLRYVLRAWRMEAQERRAHDEAERAVRLRNSLLALLQHETRTPLNAIVGYAELLEQAARQSLGPTAFVSEIRSAGQSLSRTLQRVFYFAELASGAVSLSPEAVPATDLLGEVVRGARETAAAANVAVSIEPPPQDLCLRVDAEHFARALRELLVNAITCSPPGSEVWLSAHRDPEDDGGNAVLITVSDAGPGLPAEISSLCSEPFAQEEEPMTRTRDGLGLGIPTAQKIIALHGGCMAYSSAPSGGALVSIRLPLHPRAMCGAGEDRSAA